MKKLILLQTVVCLLLAAPRAHAQVEGDPEQDDLFGRCVATGDFNGDGEDDLAIGVSGEDIGSIDAAGCRERALRLLRRPHRHR